MLYNDEFFAFLQFNSRNKTGPAFSSPTFSITPAFFGPPFFSTAFSGDPMRY